MKRGIRLRRFRAVLALVIGVSAIASGADYKGVTLRVAALSGITSEHWRSFAQQWAKENGARIELTEFPLTTMYERIMTDLVTGGSFDIIQYPSFWKGDIMGGGFALPLGDMIKKDDPGWNDYLPVYRERLSNWGGKTYGLQIDGDVWIFAYRKDLIDNPEEQAAFKERFGYPLSTPQTWKQYLDVAEFFNRKRGEKLAGKTLNEDIAGNNLSLKRGGGMNSVWTFLAIFASHLKSDLVYDGGIYFDPDTMEPLINTPAGVRAMEIMAEAASPKRSSPGSLDMDWSTFGSVFPAGKTVMGFGWPDLGPFSIDASRSNIVGSAGFAVIPGAEEVWDVKTKKWEKPDKPQHACPLAWGWTLIITNNAKNPQAAYDVIKYLVTGEPTKTLAVNPNDGMDPFRASTFSDQDVVQAFAKVPDFLPALQRSIEVGVPDLMIPRTIAYYDTLEIAIDDALRGRKTPQEALNGAATAWKQLTEQIGKDSQKKNYRESLGLK
jgi:multiple sugar transport system substrate-binding protein